MPGLVPGIHVFLAPWRAKTWMAGQRRAEATPSFGRLCPAMTSYHPVGATASRECAPEWHHQGLPVCWRRCMRCRVDRRARAHVRASKIGTSPALQHPRQMVFIFASNFEFSTASSSTYFARSVRFLDSAGLSAEIGASDSADLSGAVEALEVLGLASVCGSAVLL